MYNISQGFADSELDSEISSLFSYGREVPNLHLMSPLEYAAMLKQVPQLLGPSSSSRPTHFAILQESSQR